MVVRKKRTTRRQTLFFAPKNPRLAKIISIESPTAFRKSIRLLSRGGLTLKEKRALVLAQNRARAQLGRKNLSLKERRQFGTISKIKIGPVTKRKKR